MSRGADTVGMFSGCWTGRTWPGCRAGVSLSCYCSEEIYSCDDASARQPVRASVDACMTMIALLLPTSSILVMLVRLATAVAVMPGWGAEAQALPMLRKPNRRLLPNKRKARPIVPPCTRNEPGPARHMAV
jgi:hypothetical protein